MKKKTFLVLPSKFWIKMNLTVKDPLLMVESLAWSIFADRPPCPGLARHVLSGRDPS